MHRRFVAIFLLIALVGCDLTGSQRASFNTTLPKTLSSAWEVKKVSNGDTITVTDGQKEKRIRFCGIDAPEESQPLGAESKTYLEKLFKNVDSENLQIDEVDRDRYGRSVSEVFVIGDEKSGDKLINVEMVAAGMAYVDRQHLKNCLNAATLERSEAIAQQKRLGVWRGNYQKPVPTP